MKAKIAAQALEIKENHIRLSNYEKELARVGIREIILSKEKISLL